MKMRFFSNIINKFQDDFHKTLDMKRCISELDEEIREIEYELNILKNYRNTKLHEYQRFNVLIMRARKRKN